MADPAQLLIVRQRPAAHPELADLVAELQSVFQLDAYVTRQHLLGSGLAQLAQGEAADLDAIAAALRRHGYPCWVIPQPRPAFAPPRLLGLTITDEAIDCRCEGDRHVRLPRGTPAVGVLADLSGELTRRQVSRLLAQNAYLGDAAVSLFTPEETRQAILKGQPVFDCYLLDTDGMVTAAFRVFAGRFNPEGLGGRAGLSATRNLEAVVDLVGEYTRPFTLYSDFGLSQLPGCQPQPAGADPNLLLNNLDALTCYGWLVASLRNPAAASGDDPAAENPGTLLAAGLGGTAVLAGQESAVPESQAVAAGLANELEEQPASAQGFSPPAALPPPPARPEPASLSLRRVVPVLAVFLGGVLLALGGPSRSSSPLFRQLLHSGLLPALVAGGCCWGAFVCLRLKRRIEDTPTSRIRSLAMGLVEVRGRARRCYALVAPMTQSPCVWYRLRKYRRDSRNQWSLRSESDSSHVPFVLDDGSGRVTVEPAGATVKVATRQTGYPGNGTVIGAAVEGGPDEKWVEELIYEGTTLYILGYARPARFIGGGLRARTVAALRRLKLDPQALRRYDTNGDGRLDADEWQAARGEAEQLAAVEQLREEAAATAVVVLGRSPRGLPFLLAETRSEWDLSRKYSWAGTFLLVAGMALAAIALRLALAFFN
jgi:hypothetical protein